MRDQLLVALRARIDTATETGDAAEILADQALAEADRLLGFLARDDDLDIEILLVVGILHWVRGGARPDEDGLVDRRLAATMLVPIYLNRPEALPEPVRDSITAVFTEIYPAETYPDGVDRGQAFAEAWSDLGMLLMERRIRLGERHVAPAAIALFRTAAGALPPGHPSRALVLCNLGYALLLDHDDEGKPHDVDEAVAVLREAFAGTPVAHPNYTRCANGLALVLRAKASLTEDMPLLVEAIELFRIAVERATEVDENLPRILHDLALSLLVWAEHATDADSGAIPEAIAALERSIAAMPRDDPAFGERLDMLRRAHMMRVTHEARAREPEPADELGRPIEEAMAHLTAPDGSDGGGNLYVAVLQLLNMDDAEGDSRHAQLVDFQRTLMRYPHEASMAEVQAKAAETLVRRFDHLDPAERPEAIRRYLESEKAPPAEPVDPAILDEVIEVHDRLLPELSDGDPEVLQLVRLTRGLLALAQTMAWGGSGGTTPERLAELKTRFADAMKWMPKLESIEFRGQRFDAQRILSTSARGRALLSPFEIMAVNESAVKGYRQRLAELSPHDPDRLLVRGYLANALFGRYNITSEEHVFAEAVGLVRLVIAEAWPPPDPKTVAAWGNSAVSRIRRMGLGNVPLDQTGGDRSTGSGTVVLTSKSVADAAAVGDGVDALESLEEGRALMLSTALRTRRELHTLRAADPELARRFQALREEIYAVMNPGMEPRSGARERYAELDVEWGELLDRIKAVPGFDRFLMPLSLSVNDLLPAAADGPVVTINVNPDRCDALALRADGVRVIPLPDLRAAELVEHADAFHTAVGVLSAPDRDQRGLAVGAARQAITDTLGWLWDVLAEPVLTELEFNGMPPDGRPWPRIWWSPTGPLNFLPLHAAGHHDVFGMSVLDRVVSSYTPTVRALLHSRSHSAAMRRTALAVAMPLTAGHAALPATASEITAFASRFPGREPLVGPTATRDAVLSALPDASVAHFACHASSDPADPSASHLVLHDGPLALSEISQQQLDHAELAYLSACATARGGTGLADEAIHIVSAFQLAGYAQAIGTMWEIEDGVAARFAVEFHKELAKTIDDPVRPAGAHALHAVTRRLRAELRDRPWLWAAYLHAGA